MKQTEIAQRLGISKSYLSMILSGQRKANPELVERISSQIPVNSKAKLCLISSLAPCYSQDYRFPFKHDVSSPPLSCSVHR
jgi:transcriptional regulator with XRE-family HTH domain